MEVNLLHKNKTENIPNGYKKTIVGIIPKDWQVKKFKEITDILKCGIASTPTYVEKGVPFLSSQNVKENKFILDKYNYVSEEFHEKLTKNAKPQRGDILYTRVGANFGKAAVVDFDWEFSIYVSLTLIRMKQGYNNYFYSYLLNSDKYVYNARRTVFQGGGVQNLNVKEVEKFDMVVPPYNEQEKIASILLTWDKAIELKEKLIEQKKKQKKGLMQKLLTGEVRLPGFDGEWKKVKLAKVVRKTKGKAVEYIEGGKFPAIDMDYLESGTFKNYSNDATVFAEKNDVLLLWDGSRAGMAFTGVEGAVGSTFVKLECKSIHNIFLQKHFEMNEQRIQRLREGSGIPHVPKDFLDYYKVKMPSMEEQKAIAYVLNNMDRDLELLWKEVAYLKEQKQGLMQLLLTGKVRVQV
ncbi:restriction endonuclease subunit S [Heyndrickxia coagulans]|uniref:restriction endonuclease subunit S n=1 Tax=Heyndrickxia coagulans TaxID=1398 RepID=UPI00069A07ED|nr:restriction endonuclease subunit S [Heyndrickxia coagulans]